YRIPAGVTVMSAMALIQRAAEHWPDPLAFRPERFLDGQPAPYTWIPFGGGVRRCLGASFALVEMRAVLRAVLRRVELAALRAEPERARLHHVTLVPSRGAEAVVTARRAVSERPLAAATA